MEPGINAQQQVRRRKRKLEPEEDIAGVINTSAGVVTVEEDLGKPPPASKFKTGIWKVPNAQKNGKRTKKFGKIARKKKSKVENLKNDDASDKMEVDEEEDENLQENQDFQDEEWVKLGVPDIVLKALKEKQFDRPTTIQALTLAAAILGKKDIVGAAETGSGKTLAFAIPIINGITAGAEGENPVAPDDEEEKGLQALILTPTRELAVQIKDHFDVIAKYTNIKTVVIVGGLAPQKQERLLRGRPGVVVATPGRLWELLQEGEPHLSTLNEIKYLAIDETDRMVEKGHFQELEGILNVINTDESFQSARQNFVFSATLAFTHEPPQRLKNMGSKMKKKHKQPKKMTAKEKLSQIMEMVGVRQNPKIVDITTSKGTCETLIEKQISCTKDHKDYYLYYFLLQYPGRTIVFSNSINCVRRLTNLFFLLQCGEVLPLHSEMHQKQRLRNLERFTANEKGILIATDVAARGLDIKDILHVIHYEVPKTAESYIHRSGRTARAFKGGVAVLMIEPAETTTVKHIFRSLGRDVMPPDFEVNGKTFQEMKSTIEMAVKVEQFEHRIRKKLSDHNWLEKAKKDMDLATSSDESDDDGDGNVSQKKSLMQAKKQLENYKKQLSQMVVSNSKHVI